jgi:hypothetical protein
MTGPENIQILIALGLVNIPGTLFLIWPSAFFLMEKQNPMILVLSLLF